MSLIKRVLSTTPKSLFFHSCVTFHQVQKHWIWSTVGSFIWKETITGKERLSRAMHLQMWWCLKPRDGWVAQVRVRAWKAGGKWSAESHPCPSKSIRTNREPRVRSLSLAERIHLCSSSGESSIKHSHWAPSLHWVISVVYSSVSRENGHFIVGHQRVHSCSNNPDSRTLDWSSSKQIFSSLLPAPRSSDNILELSSNQIQFEPVVKIRNVFDDNVTKRVCTVGSGGAKRNYCDRWSWRLITQIQRPCCINRLLSISGTRVTSDGINLVLQSSASVFIVK